MPGNDIDIYLLRAKLKERLAENYILHLPLNVHDARMMLNGVIIVLHLLTELTGVDFESISKTIYTEN